MSTETLPCPISPTSESEEQGFMIKLKAFRVTNIHIIIIVPNQIN